MDIQFQKNQRLKKGFDNLRDWVERKDIDKTYRHTMEHCLRLAIYQLIEHEQLFNGIDPNNLPGFHTYTPSLASTLGCCKRTIQNHKRKLFKFGFFTREERLGQYGYQLWINPDILLKDQNFKFNFKSLDLFSTSQNPHQSGIAQELRTLVPELSLEPIINRESNVDTLKSTSDLEHKRSSIDFELNQKGNDQSNMCAVREKRDCPGTNSGNLLNDEHGTKIEVEGTHIGNIVKNFKLGARDGDHKRPITPPKDLRRDNVQVPGTDRPATAKSDQDLLKLVVTFWKVAKSLLWSDLPMWETREREIMNVIWLHVFQKFTIKDYDYWHSRLSDEFFNRLHIAAKWKKETRWNFPDPKAYFDPTKNKHGWNGTYRMLQNYFTNAKQWERDKVIEKLKHYMNQYDQGKGRHKKKDRKQLIQLLLRGVEKRNDKQLNQEISQRFAEIFNIRISKKMPAVVAADNQNQSNIKSKSNE